MRYQGRISHPKLDKYRLYVIHPFSKTNRKCTYDSQYRRTIRKYAGSIRPGFILVDTFRMMGRIGFNNKTRLPKD